MFTARLTAGGASTRLLAVAVLSLVLGMLGMHALNTHTAMGGTAHAEMSASTAGAAGHRVGEVPAIGSDAHAGAAAPAEVTLEAAGAAPVAPEHDMGQMAMLCAFMILAAAGLALLGALLLRRVPASSWLSVRNALTRVPTRSAGTATGAGPPPVWAFSVIRC